MLNNVVKLLFQNQVAHPDNPTIIYANQRLSYSELLARSVQVAGLLKQHQIESGQTIGLLLKSSPQYLIAYYASLLIGAIPALLPTYLSTNKLTYNCNKLKIETVVFEPEYQKIVDEVELKKGTPLLKLSTTNWKELTTQEIINPASAFDSFPGIDSLNEPAVISFTDGNSGFAKIVVHSQHSLLINAQNCLKILNGLSSVRMLCTLPIFHYISHSFIPHTLALVGGTLLIPQNFHFEEIRQTIIQNQANVLVGTPSFFKQFINAADSKIFESWKYCIVVGGTLQEDIWREFIRTHKMYVTELYGTTETLILTSSYDEYDRREAIIGRPLPGIDIRIINPSGAVVTPGKTGKLQVSTPTLMLNYFEDLQRPSLDKNTWFETGDLVRETQDGRLIFEGRIADTIKKYGFDINPVQIENIVKQHSAVRDVVAASLKDSTENEQIKLYILPQEKEPIDIQELTNYCQQNLPGYQQPDTIEIVSHFEHDLSGKILRNLLNKS